MNTIEKLSKLLEEMEETEIQVYENYRALYDEFRAILKSFIKDDKNIKELNKEERTALGNCILKACDMRVILKEKYEELGKELLCR